MVMRNPAGIASRKNQRKDSKAKPVSRMKRTAMEGTGSGNCRGHGIQMPKAMAIPREPASGAGSARKASLGQGMRKWTPVNERRFLAKAGSCKRSIGNFDCQATMAHLCCAVESEERE